MFAINVVFNNIMDYFNRKLISIIYTSIFIPVLLIGCTLTNSHDIKPTSITLSSEIANTVVPSYTAVPTKSATPTITPTPNHPSGQVIHHYPYDEIVYDWFSYLPQSISKNEASYILITGVHGNITTGIYSEVINESNKQIE